MEVIDNEPLQVSFPLPRSIDTRVFIHLTIKAKAVTLFLTTANQDEPSSPAAMGSFVYALPDRLNPAQPISTTLYVHEPTLEFTQRMAKLIAKRANMPVYVTNSSSFTNCPEGGTVEEEMDVFKRVVDVVIERVRLVVKPTAAANGV
ncbi:hypothetical protein D7B24_004874 [Verticillium nonalfalfae]|uniref:Uncharacterized protein n=1 Tax=Verticillium nonalfalfae TaxID=1051616 RepID=A0A3M9YDI7_9PEZI|nr:uncharacterized protein D7B24_004874 [Verticillium nonalfalfae]RNJ58235.1 hypothetical protein D7B24_004874 [Verticillium nonalfalfae]